MLTYENLPGATGSRIFFKPERVKARDLFKGSLPALSIGNVSGVLEEVGMTELAVFVRSPSTIFAVSGRPLTITITLDGTVLEEVQGTVSEIERADLGQRLILQITQGYIDVRRLQARHRSWALRNELDAVLDTSSEAVSPAYRLLCVEAVELFRHLQETLDRFESSRPSADAQAEMFAMCEDRVLPRWHDIWRRANALVAPIMNDQQALAATKRFTERVLTPHVVPGAIWRRSYEKPLGYPGDFQIMSMVYDWQREGNTFFQKFCHRIGLEVAECIATRLNIIRRAIAETVNGSKDGVARIASLGSGPAREVCDFLAGCHPLPRSTVFTLIDQDTTAMASVYERTLPDVLLEDGRSSVDCLNASFIQLMKAGELFGKLPGQDLIYSVGLIDYLNDKRCRNLIASLYDHLKPQGRLIIGNMHDVPSGNLWPMEFLTDWNIIYRTEQQMHDLAAGLPEASIRTELDSTGRVVMLHVRKP